MDYPLRIFLTLNNIFVSLANWYIFQFKQYAAEAVCFEVWKYSSTAFHPFRCTHIFLAALSHHQHHHRQNHHHHHYHHHQNQLSVGALCISCKSGHQVVPFALLHCLGLPYRLASSVTIELVFHSTARLTSVQKSPWDKRQSLSFKVLLPSPFPPFFVVKKDHFHTNDMKQSFRKFFTICWWLLITQILIQKLCKWIKFATHLCGGVGAAEA